MNPSSIAPKVNRTSVENAGAIAHKTLVSTNNLVSNSWLNDDIPDYEWYSCLNKYDKMFS